jgi:conjugative relaxase-like TrwC/TraI family protein
VLGIHRLTSSGTAYYLSDLALELPRCAPGEAGPAVWVGRAADGLGLQGPIDAEHMGAVLDGRHPLSGFRLRSGRASVSGFDLTFSAPKSASVVFALGGQDAAAEVLAAHREGVRGALDYVEAHALTAQRGSGEQREVVPTTGLVAASFTHGTNRNLDPHLHTHVVMANMVHGPDGRWSACDHRGISAHRGAASAIYEAHLRAVVSRRLGVQWAEAPGLRAEIEGVSPLLLGEFSSRAADIRRHMAEWGAHSARGAHVAWAATRADKQAGISFGDLSSEWERRARSVGMAPAELRSLFGSRRLAGGGECIHEHRFAAALSWAPDGAARRRDVVAAFGAAVLGGAHVTSVERLTDLWTPPRSDRVQVGVAEDIRPLRTVVPGSHLLHVLGPRPVNPSEHEVWRDAAHAIDDYRRRWRVNERSDVLGVDRLPAGISSLPTDRLVEHLHLTRHIEVARQRLGRRDARALEMDRGR